MAAAGLTNGAFYAHFASKEDLVATAVADQLRDQLASFSGRVPGRAGVEQYVRDYLSVQHRDNPGDGCPSAALLDEIGRCTDATRQAYTDGVLAIIDDAAARLAPDDPPSARMQTLGVFALMAGTLQLSRALADRQLADEVLEQGIQNALALAWRACLPQRFTTGGGSSARSGRCACGTHLTTPRRDSLGSARANGGD
jgi:TetR/AcrR family transcriptional regulator, transcriptional repressor for nem operon